MLNPFGLDDFPLANEDLFRFKMIQNVDVFVG